MRIYWFPQKRLLWRSYLLDQVDLKNEICYIQLWSRGYRYRIGSCGLDGLWGGAALVLDGDSGGQSIDSQIQEREAHIQTLNGRKAEWQGKVEDYAGKKKIILEIDSIESKIQQQQKLSAAATDSVREASDRVAAVVR